MRINQPVRFVFVIAILTAALSGPAYAAEPRPWLCRDKPVFSYDRRMEYEASARPGLEWRLFFLQSDPSGGHDGFSVVGSRDLGTRGSPVNGSLDPGQYFAVALYQAQGGYWVCPGYANDSGSRKLGELGNLCFGQSGATCKVTLKVRPDHMLVPAQPPASP